MRRRREQRDKMCESLERGEREAHRENRPLRERISAAMRREGSVRCVKSVCV